MKKPICLAVLLLAGSRRRSPLCRPAPTRRNAARVHARGGGRAEGTRADRREADAAQAARGGARRDGSDRAREAAARTEGRAPREAPPIRWLCVTALVLAGCEAHLEELAAVEAHLDAQIAAARKRCENLNDQRKAVDDLEQRLDAALTALPPGVDAGQPPPLVRSPEPARPPEPPMPLVNTLERAEAAKARARIEAKRDELRLLDRVVGEVRNIDRRKAEIRHRLEHLEGLKR